MRPFKDFAKGSGPWSTCPKETRQIDPTPSVGKSTSLTPWATPKRGSPYPQLQRPRQSVGVHIPKSRGDNKAWGSAYATKGAMAKCASPYPQWSLKGERRMVPLRFLSREVLVQGDHIHVRGAIGKVSGGLDLQTRDFNLPNPCVEMTRKSLGGLHCPVDGGGGLRNEGRSCGEKNGELLPPHCTPRTASEVSD